MSASAFLHLGATYMSIRRNRNQQYLDKKFIGHFGVNSARCAEIWQLLQQHNIMPMGGAPKHLLFSLHYMKQYGTEVSMASFFSCDEKTLRKWAWIFIKAMAKLAPIVIRFDARLDHNGKHKVSVDGTDFKIEEPSPFDPGWYSFKHNGPGVRYEVALHLRKSLIVWINGPFPCGAFPDDKIFKGKLMHRLLPNEKVISDAGYKKFPEFCTFIAKDRTVNGEPASYKKRHMIGKLLARHETVNKRFKQFNILKNVFRAKLGHHKHVFQAIAAITQLGITSDEPLFDAYAD
jgi:hypothetical protein